MLGLGLFSLAPSHLRAQGGSRVPLAEALAALSEGGGPHFSYRTDALDGLYVPAPAVPPDTSALGEVRTALATRGLRLWEVEPGRFLVGRGGHPGADPAAAAALTLLVTDGREPLPGATLRASDGRGWVTDADGRVALPPGALPEHVEVQYIGYATRVVSAESLRVSGGEVRLSPKPYTTPAAVVTAALPPRTLRAVASDSAAAASFGESRLALLPSGLDQAGFLGMAGASGIDGASAIPALRGSGPDETLVVLDGLPLLHVDHFLGLFPAIPPDAINLIDVYRSHYPAQWGGYRGGLLDVQTRSAPTDGLSVEASQVAAGVVAEGHAGKLSALLSARSTLDGLVSDTLFGSGTPDFRFREGYARLRYGAPGDQWRAEWNGYGSRDAYDFRAEQVFSVERPRRTFDYVGAYTEANTWTNAGTRAALHFTPGPRRYTLDAYVSSYGQDLEARSNFRLARRPSAEGVTRRDNALRNRAREEQIGLHVAPGNDAVTPWTAGVQFQRFVTEAGFRFRELQPLSVDQSDTRLSAYGAYEARLPAGFRLDAGLRATQSVGGGDGWWSPRVQLSKTLAAAKPAAAPTLRLGYSYTRQNIRTLQHENQYGQVYPVYVLEVPGRGEEPAAHNLTLGYRARAKAWQLDVEAYHRWLPGVLAVRSDTLGLAATSAIDSALFTPRLSFATFSGTGEVLGVDVDFRYARRGFEGQVAYTLARSRQRFRNVAQGAWQRAPDDRRHRLATSHSYRHGPWRAGLAFELASGLTYTDVNALEGRSATAMLRPGDYQRTLPAYARLDVQGAYAWRWGPATGTVGLRLFNVLDRENVSHREYLVAVGRGQGTGAGRAVALGTDVTLLGRLLLVEIAVQL